MKTSSNGNFFSRYWLFVRGIHRSPVNSPHKGQWRGALMFSLICTWINGGVNNHEAGDLRRYRAHYDVSVMMILWFHHISWAALWIMVDWIGVYNRYFIWVYKSLCMDYDVLINALMWYAHHIYLHFWAKHWWMIYIPLYRCTIFR